MGVLVQTRIIQNQNESQNRFLEKKLHLDLPNSQFLFLHLTIFRYQVHQNRAFFGEKLRMEIMALVYIATESKFCDFTETERAARKSERF